jgi:hypothetical protein
MFVLPSIGPLLMMLPGIMFWLHLVAWILVWPVVWGPGENWWPVLIQYGLFVLSLVFFLISLVVAIVARKRNHNSGTWWLAALIDLTPALLLLAVFIGIPLMQSLDIRVHFP